MQAIVKTILDRVLGPYCDFEGDINFDMWSGKAVLRHIRIKPDAIESVGIPIDIKSGFIDRIGLVCDWRSGFNKPVEVELSHVYAVVSPRKDFSNLNLEKIRKDALQAKRDQKSAELKAWEDAQFDPEKGFVGKLGRRLLRIQPKSRKQSIQEAVDYTSPENMTQLEKMVAKIMANLRIKVSNVHIRLESEDNAVGIKIGDFSIQTTDELFKPTFVKNIGDRLYKYIALEGFLVYVNSGPSIRSRMEKRDLLENEAPASEPQFRYVLKTEIDEDNIEFLLSPVSFTVHATMQQRPTEKMPKMKIDAYLEDVKLVFTSYQYRSVLKVQAAMAKASEVLDKLIGPEIYAEGNGDSNLVDLDREYIELYRRTLHVPGVDLRDLSKDEEARLTTLELKHTTDEIEFYRKSVLNEFDEFLVRRSGQLKYEIRRKRDVPRENGWFSWLKSSKSNANAFDTLLPSEAEIETVLDTPIVEEDEQKALSTVFSDVSFKIPEISLTLVGDKAKLLHGAIVGSEFRATALNVSSIDIDATISKISLSNLLFEKSAFPEILYPSATDENAFGETSLVHLLVRVNPTDISAKYVINGGIEPLDVVADYILLQHVLPFFSFDVPGPEVTQPEPETDQSLNIISSLTASTPKDVALARRPSVIVDLKISAPTVLIPENPLQKDTLLLVVDLGCFFISTRPAFRGATEVDMSSIDVSDIKDIENPVYKRVYDNFTLEYKNLQIFISEHGKDWRSYYNPDSTESKLLCPVSSSLFIGLCVLLESGPLATLVVNVHFNPFTIQMSPNDLKQIMVISTGFQLMAQSQKSSANVHADSAAVTSRSHRSSISKDQAIPSDLALNLSGKETDVDAFVNVTMDGLEIALLTDSKKPVIRAGIDGVALDLTRRTFDTTASFSIHQMYVEECLYKTKLILSYLSTASSLPQDSTISHFIICRYLQKDRISPSFQEIDHLAELSVGLLELNLEPTSLRETAQFIKTMSEAVTLPPQMIENIQSAFDQDYFHNPASMPDASADDTPVTVFSIHPKFDGILLRTLIQQHPVMEASIRQVQCDVTQDITGILKVAAELDSLQIEIAGQKDTMVLSAGFQSVFSQTPSHAWNLLSTIDALCINRQDGDVAINVLRPANIALKMSSVPLADSSNALHIDVDADQLHLVLSYSSILLCRNSAMTLMQAFDPVLDSIGKNDVDLVESGDAFPVPMKIDIPTSVEKKNEALPNWQLNEYFNFSLKSIRIDVTNDISRIPVLELLVVIDPKSEGHGYGNVRHMYLGFVLSARVFDSKASVWEPFIEPASVAVISRQTASLKELSIALNDKFDVNISHHILRSFMDSYRSFTSALTAPAFVGNLELLLRNGNAESSVKTPKNAESQENELRGILPESGSAVGLQPTRIIQNLLPVTCVALSSNRSGSWQDQSPVLPPTSEHGLMTDPKDEIQLQIQLPFMQSWSAPVSVEQNSKQTVLVMDQQGNKLTVFIEVQDDKILIYVGYWVYDLVQLPDGIQLQISSESFESVPAIFPPEEFSSKSGTLEPLIEPLMFHSDSGKAHLRLSLQNSQWSRPFSIQPAGSSEIVSVVVGNECYQFIVNSSLCTAPFTRTKKVVCSPRYILVNSLHFPIVFKQVDDPLIFRLESGETRPFYKWPNFKLPEKLSFKRDDASALWSGPVSISDVTDETLTFYGTNWSRFARLEVQRGNSSFLMLSHQKPSLIPLVILNRTAVCNVWVRQNGHLNWHHLAPQTGYPLGSDSRFPSDFVSFKLGWVTSSGALISKRIDLNLNDLKDKESIWKYSDAHDIVFALEQRGPFRSVIISERIFNREALCSALSFVHSNINQLVSQWSTKNIEFTELAENPLNRDRHFQLTIVECSHLDVPSESSSVYLTATLFDETVQTPVVADVVDPYFAFKHDFAVGDNVDKGFVSICVYTLLGSKLATLFCKFDIPIDFNTSVVDRWFNLEIQNRTVGQIHLFMQFFDSKCALIKNEMQVINATLLMHQGIAKELDTLMDSIPDSTSMTQMSPESVRQNQNQDQRVRLSEFQIFPIEIRGNDIPEPKSKPASSSTFESVETGVGIPRNSEQKASSVRRRIICEFKANAPGPDKDAYSAMVLTDWEHEQIAAILRESFSFRALNDSPNPPEVPVEVILKEELREGANPAQYTVIDRLVFTVSKALDGEWLKFQSGKNEIRLTVVQQNIELSQTDMFKAVSQTQLFCNHIGLSFVDRLSREILYICMLKTYLSMIDTDDQLGVSIYIGSMQCDNQMLECLYPVALFPKKRNDKSGKEIPWLQAAALNLKDKQNEGFMHLQFLNLLLQETNIFIDEELVWALYEFGTEMADIVKPLESLSEPHLGLSISDYREHPAPGSTSNVYIQDFILHPVAVNLTFQPDVTRREQKRLRVVSRYANPVDMLLGAAGVTLTNIKEAPVRIDSLEMSDVFGSWQTLLDPIQKYYLIQILQQGYKILGSLSVLGNPVGLVSNLGKGVKHLFYDPAQGLVSSPLDFGKGLATGSTKFFQHTVGGLLSSAGQITSSLGTGVAVLTMDRAYLEKREKDERERILEANQGVESHNVATGLMAFGSGLIGGIRGAVEKPVAGLKEGGAKGFLKGIVKGGAGLIAQPIVGVIDLGTHTVQGVQGAIGRPSEAYGVTRCRSPRGWTKSQVGSSSTDSGSKPKRSRE